MRARCSGSWRASPTWQPAACGPVSSWPAHPAIRTVVVGESLLFPAAIRRLAAQAAPAPEGLAGVGLTEREREVLRLMATGLSNVEIAGELYLGIQTVKTHVGNILAKLGARDRTQAVVRAYDSGFVTPSG